MKLAIGIVLAGLTLSTFARAQQRCSVDTDCYVYGHERCSVGGACTDFAPVQCASNADCAAGQACSVQPDSCTPPGFCGYGLCTDPSCGFGSGGGGQLCGIQAHQSDNQTSTYCCYPSQGQNAYGCFNRNAITPWSAAPPACCAIHTYACSTVECGNASDGCGGLVACPANVCAQGKSCILNHCVVPHVDRQGMVAPALPPWGIAGLGLGLSAMAAMILRKRA